MNDKRTISDEPLTDAQDEMLAKLIRSAGRREGPPPEHYDRVFAAAHEALERKRGQRRSRRNRILAVAASVCIALVGSLLLLQPNTGPQQLIIARVIGAAEWRAGPDAPWSAIETDEIAIGAAGQLRTTGGSGLSVLLGDVSLRLADTTTIRLLAANELHLDQGKIYIDSGPGAGTAVRVVTPAATATDIGTQFEVRFINNAYRLRVREGQVRLAANHTDLGNAALNGASDEVRISADGNAERSQIAPDDTDWAWAENLAPAPEINGQSLRVLLDWVARETGREIVYADPLVELQSKQIIMHGAVQNLSPMRALDVVLATTDLAATTTDKGRILIKAANTTD